MAVCEQQLKSWVPEFVVTAHVQQKGGSCLRRPQAFCRVIESFRAQRQLFANVALHQPARKRKVAQTIHMVEKRFSASAIGGPWPPALLRPQGHLVPGLANSQAPGGAASGKF